MMQNESATNHFDAINSPEDLRKLNLSELSEFCVELRQSLIEFAAKHGGHFASSLGVVELTSALHYVFNTPYDKIVWDVGHQAYAHKLITGRKGQFHTNRKQGGIGPFPNPEESEYDAFIAGHASVSISAALGMAVASKAQGEPDRQHIAVIGDGSLTGGIAFEGLNNAGVQKSNILVILNDNNMAIDENVGALKDYLTNITTSHTFNKLRDEIWDLMGKFKTLGTHAQNLAHTVETSLKSLVSQQSNFFESLNFRYFGPVDGHNIEHLTKILSDLKEIDGPKLLHVITKKGKGFKHAEDDPLKWHAAPGIFDAQSGEIEKKSSNAGKPPKYQDVFGETILELARENEKIMGITPAMPSGSSLNLMMKEMPQRTFDVGIAEQHAVTFSAGLAAQGIVPFCNVYSSFLQRSYDQLIHDVALQKLPVIFCLDRAGLVGADGSTHQGTYDMAFMRAIPHMVVSAPMNEIELRNLMFTATHYTDGPFSIRYPRGTGVTPDWKCSFETIPVGIGRTLVEGESIAFVTIGTIGNAVTEALIALKSEGYNPGHYDMRFVKPLDTSLLDSIFKKYDHIITVEDGCITGGFGSAVAEHALESSYKGSLNRFGIPDIFIDHATQEEQHTECGIDALGIVTRTLEILKK
ncbi:MAG: 1-deoxy-D-xylulose-5-phosphate synthase [Fibrobacterales bacterium]